MVERPEPAGGWPNAGLIEQRFFEVSASAHPTDHPLEAISSFLGESVADLSHRAAAGFFARLTRSGLRRPGDLYGVRRLRRDGSHRGHLEVALSFRDGPADGGGALLGIVMLPEPQNPPTSAPQALGLLLVALTIAFDLRRPVVGVLSQAASRARDSRARSNHRSARRSVDAGMRCRHECFAPRSEPGSRLGNGALACGASVSGRSQA